MELYVFKANVFPISCISIRNCCFCRNKFYPKKHLFQYFGVNKLLVLNEWSQFEDKTGYFTCYHIYYQYEHDTDDNQFNT